MHIIDPDAALSDEVGRVRQRGALRHGGAGSRARLRRTTERRRNCQRCACGGGEGGSLVGGGGGSSPGASTAAADAPADKALFVPKPPLPNRDLFYTPPSPLPTNATPGTILKWRRQGLTLDPVGRKPVPGADAYTVMFVSTTARGELVALVGAVFVPRAPWAGGLGFPRPLVSFSDATRGLGDKCASTWMYAMGVDVEGMWVAAMLKKGWAVAVFDRQALFFCLSGLLCGEGGRGWVVERCRYCFLGCCRGVVGRAVRAVGGSGAAAVGLLGVGWRQRGGCGGAGGAGRLRRGSGGCPSPAPLPPVRKLQKIIC